MLFMNKLEFSSLVDCFVWISETIGAVRYGFLSGVPPFNAFLIVVFIGTRCSYIKIKCNKRKRNAIFKANKEKMQTKPSPHPLSAVAVKITSPRKPWGGGGGDPDPATNGPADRCCGS